MFTNDDLICSYTRAEALADGVLIDVSERAQRAGIQYPTACTAGVWSLIDCLPASVTFEALGASLWAQCGPGDTAAPVITILREGED